MLGLVVELTEDDDAETTDEIADDTVEDTVDEVIGLDETICDDDTGLCEEVTVDEDTLCCDEVVTEIFEDVFSYEEVNDESSVEVNDEAVPLEVEVSEEVVSKTGGRGNTISEVSPWKSFSVRSPSGLDSSSVEGVHFDTSEAMLWTLLSSGVDITEL